MAYHTKGFLEAIEIAGSQSKLGELIELSQQSISIALNASKPPIRMAIAIHKATGVPLSKLHPEFEGLADTGSKQEPAA
ncbi:MAG: hypothetical protein AXW12_00575 [Thalassospira sp. Nap_22]|nr:MAG: hypothetical protein AXW12_00575 [Thalassospira sp. Nap_22]